MTSILIWGIKQLTDNSSGKIRKSDLSLEISFIMQQCIKEVERGVVMNSLFSEDYYKYIFENSLDAIMITKPDGKIVKANPAPCKMLGWTEEELGRVGRDGIIDLKDPKFKEALDLRKRDGKDRCWD